jgi:hypothetical protein
VYAGEILESCASVSRVWDWDVLVELVEGRDV